MNKKYLIVISLIVFVLSFSIPLLIIKSNNKNEEKKNEQKTEELKQPEVKKDDNEFTDIDKNSELAHQLLDFVPKHFQGSIVNINNEFRIYSALYSLKYQNYKPTELETDAGILQGYSYADVEKEVKRIFGSEQKIEIQSKYTIPIEYKNNIFCLLPFGFSGNEYLQSIKQVKENKDVYILTIYAINLEYDMEDDDFVKVATKETFELSKNNSSTDEQISNSMKKYRASGIDIDAEIIVKEYKDELPLIEYEIVKLDDRGTKYYLKSINYK